MQSPILSPSEPGASPPLTCMNPDEPYQGPTSEHLEPVPTGPLGPGGARARTGSRDNKIKDRPLHSSTHISFSARIHDQDIDLGTVCVPDGSERSAATIAAAMHDVAERIEVWSRFRAITREPM
jgi:hypothetical protein